MGTVNKNFKLSFFGRVRDVLHAVDEGVLAPWSPEYLDWTVLRRTWYDGPDQELSQAGITFQLTQTDTRAVQSLHYQPSNQSFIAELDPDDPNFAMTGQAAIDLAVHDCGEGLQPTTYYALRRRTIRLHTQKAVMSLTVDIPLERRGGLEREGAGAQGGNSNGLYNDDIARLRASLISGKPKALCRLGQHLSERSPIWLDTPSKPNQYEWKNPSREPIGKFAKPQLRGGENARTALLASLDVAIARMSMLVPVVAETRNFYGLYQLRVALRRFRAIERTYRPYLNSAHFRALALLARDYGRVLGPARDWDVFVAETLPKLSISFNGGGGAERLLARARLRKRSAMDEAVTAVSDTAFRKFLLGAAELRATLEERGANELAQTPVRLFATDALDRRHALTFRRVGRIDQSDDDGRHQVRIALKKFRYSIQLFRTLYPKSARAPYQNGIKALQDTYGAINDAARAKDLAEQIMSPQEEPILARQLAAMYDVQNVELRAEASQRLMELKALTPFWRADPFGQE